MKTMEKKIHTLSWVLGFALHEGDNHTTNCYLWKDDVLDFEVERLGVPKFDGPSFLPVECVWEIK